MLAKANASVSKSMQGGGGGQSADSRMTSPLPTLVHGARVSLVSEVNAAEYEALVLVTGAGGPLPQALEDYVLDALRLDPALETRVGLLRCPRVSGERLVLTPAGPLTPYHDVRSVGDAMRAGVERALAAGCRRLCVVLPTSPSFPRAPLVALLAALEAIYIPLQIREMFPEKAAARVVTLLGVYVEGLHQDTSALLMTAVALETARGVARDVGGADPERMTPLAMLEMARAVFVDEPRVTVRAVQDRAELEARYPLFAAVDRAAASVSRHRGCVVFLEYTPDTYLETVMLVGKGVTYDTGGCDVKVGGAMAGMSRDKCGAAAVLGFVLAAASLSAQVRVVGALAAVRNSIGEEAYVSDELLRTTTGRSLRVGNTDAEGRMVMADLLAEMVSRAARERNPHLYTVATLTGHAHRALGPYTAVLDNHVARESEHGSRLAVAGLSMGEPGEVSTIRREDLAAHAGRATFDDIHQADSRPSTAISRGHQGPAAFLLLASGLDTGVIPYTHLDVAGSAGDLPCPPTAAPLLALAALHLLPHDK